MNNNNYSPERLLLKLWNYGGGKELLLNIKRIQTAVMRKKAFHYF